MIPLQDLHPTEVEFVAVLVGGHKQALSLRAYNMADHAWFQKTFSSPEDAEALASMRVESIAKLGWHMLTNESKAFFNNVKYTQFDEGLEKEVEVNAQGYEKLLHALDGEESFWALFDAFVKCKGENGFIAEPDKLGVKKKIATKPKMKLTGRNRLTSWLRNTATPFKKYFH